MPIFIPNLFGAYIDGRRAAIQDNWLDQKNFNDVLKGQLDNALTMDTYDPAVRGAWNKAAASDMDLAALGAETDNFLEQNELLRGMNANELIAQRRIAELIDSIRNLGRTEQMRSLEDSSGIPQKVVQNKAQTLDYNKAVTDRNMNANKAAVDAGLDMQDVKNKKLQGNNTTLALEEQNAYIKKEAQLKNQQLEVAKAQLQRQLAEIEAAIKQNAAAAATSTSSSQPSSTELIPTN